MLEIKKGDVYPAFSKPKFQCPNCKSDKIYDNMIKGEHGCLNCKSKFPSPIIIFDESEENKRWVSVESLETLDIYRLLCSKLGKAKVWNLNADELCEAIKNLLKKQLKGEQKVDIIGIKCNKV